MTIVEAIIAIRNNATNVARPKSWSGSGQAVMCHAGGLFVVPSPSGGYGWRATARDITEDWEVVSLDVVTLERADVAPQV